MPFLAEYFSFVRRTFAEGLTNTGAEFSWAILDGFQVTKSCETASGGYALQPALPTAIPGLALALLIECTPSQPVM